MRNLPAWKKTIFCLGAALYVVLFFRFLQRPKEALWPQSLFMTEESAIKETPALPDFPTLPPETPTPTTNLLVEHPLNLNEADAWALCAIPGVGEELAGRIVAYREAVQGFVSIDELLRVSGIGESTLERIRPYVQVPVAAELSSQ